MASNDYLFNEDAIENCGSLADDKDYDYKILEPDTVVKEMLKIIKKVNEIMKFPTTITLNLLHFFKWDERKLLEKFYDEDRAIFFNAVGIVDPEQDKDPFESSSNSTEDCGICLSLLSNAMTELECEHRFCNKCWDQYLTMKIMDEGESLSISCPAHKCDILVDDATAMALITNSKVRSRYQYLIAQSFVEFNKLLKWCPAADCGRAIKVQYISSKPVTCKCGYKFCFKCCEKWHAPILCDYLTKWLKKLDEDVASSAWIILNTKNCPNCTASIEKTGGCNHMTCKKCHHEFCWICNANWKFHSVNYGCNRYRGNEVIQDNVSIATIEALDKFIFYSDRYKLQKMSKEFEFTLYNVIGDKMDELMNVLSMTWTEVQFIKDAVDMLVKCRQVLMYSYAFAYFIKDCNQKVIFEDNQRDLEEATETMSRFLEQELINEHLQKIKQMLLDKTFYCSMRIKALIDHVKEGYRRQDNNRWEHIDE